MRLVEIWRYPIASLAGERLTSVRLLASGLAEDRRFSIVCRATGEVASPEHSARWQPAPLVRARGVGLNLSVKTPQTDWLAAFGTSAEKALNDHFGFEVDIRPTGLWRGQPAGTPHVQPRYPRAPLHVITTRMLARLQEAVPAQTMIAERFRPNLVLDMDEDEEQKLIREGAALHFGLAAIELTVPTQRCGFVALAQAGMGRSPAALRTLKRHRNLQFGYYADVLTPGRLSVEEGQSAPHIPRLQANG